jgi:DNA-binding transcriptional MerR regulator
VQKDEFTLEELATATRMTARNVRAYQTKGLIPAPWRSGRRSVYGVEHLQRLQAIERARRQGASLSLIATHLAAGRSLDDGTLVEWEGDAGRTGLPDQALAPGPDAAGPGTSHDVTALLAQLDIQRDATTQAHLDDLMAAGVLRPDGSRIYTGRVLADSLRQLQQQGFPLQVALGIAQRTLVATPPVAVALREATGATGATDGTAAIRGHLREVAYYVFRYLIDHAGEEVGTPTATPPP